jgi:hypothetical protein
LDLLGLLVPLALLVLLAPKGLLDRLEQQVQQALSEQQERQDQQEPQDQQDRLVQQEPMA